MWKPLAIWGSVVALGLLMRVSGVGNTPRYGVPFVLVMLGTSIYLFGYTKPKSN